MRALALAACVAVGLACGATTPVPQRSSTSASPIVDPTPVTGASPALAWHRFGDIPTPRSEVAAAALRDSIFVVGGFGGGKRVEVFSTDQGGWTSKRDYPLEVDHAMSAATEDATGGLFVFGGNSGGQPTARVFRFDGNGWTERAPMPLPRSQAAAVAVGDKIYIVGGVTTGSRLVGDTFRYDTATDSWRTVAAIPTPRDHLAAALLDGRVCAIGGRRLSMDQNLATFECYDTRTDRWERLPDASTARGGVGAAVVGRRLFFIGGEQPAGTFKQVEIYDAAAGSWSRGPDLPTPRHGLGVVAVGQTVYVLTGGPTPGGSQIAVCEALTVP